MPRSRPVQPGNELINREEASAVSNSKQSCTCGTAIIPLLNFIAFFLNFVFADVGTISDKYDSPLTPPHYAFMIWIPIYVAEFLFVIYQLFYPHPRNSRLIQTLISLPFIFHQILTAVWLIMFSRDKIYEATGVITGIWLLALTIFSLITREFRTGRYSYYGGADYFLIEVPFGLLLGWETMALLISWTIFIIKLGVEGYIASNHLVAAQIAAFTVALSVIALASVLFAGLPTVMDPVVHIPFLWGLATLGHRWFIGEMPDELPSHLSSWLTDDIQLGLGLSAWIAAGVVCIFFCIASVILMSSRMCVPPSPSEMDESLSASTLSKSSSSSQDLTQRSPRTARSALSIERVV
eukprot:Blabericola_migrator_1__9306@NODE_4_length_29828_cov_96_571587_g3_i0_p8_GENE_NODE_4_length_29828_cov_96_571587_g3_i0NODE_4_length_29828_cov_96_571587_g3_i0_p8_ORF_typecomplete_len352_score55_11TspO_MBR/PF03073_15/5_3e06TspO_MBR/PF03073_15/1_8e04CcmF_C/PF16327_5/0_00051CcmF_C/PF16327_5/1_8e04zfLITAFlike/PF10601_9/5_1e03zfLITAFlike/PF10601_9/4_1e03zfLITAFlike/PF10601_9/0_55_NODE_4_length_29828_cov_96_571587_g3_i02405925114